MTHLTLYGRPGCHLCEEARAAVAAARERCEFSLEEVDVSLDPRLEGRYGERVPVLAVEGQEVLELRFGPQEVIGVVDRVRA